MEQSAWLGFFDLPRRVAECLDRDEGTRRGDTQQLQAPADEAVDIDNAGLVLLWPFLRHFFGHLGLLDEGRFRDGEAVQRATGLLGHLATGDPAPAEYLLPLCKVLCGMEPDEVFDFGPPV